MIIKWYGHSCFKMISSEGTTTILTDPFDQKVGYNIVDFEADIVTVSHNHYDHNNISAVKEPFTLVNRIGKYNMNEISIEGFKTYHDDSMGSKRGENIIYRYNIDGISICHLGDLGHILSNKLIQKIKDIEILLIPIGGTYTINSNQAFELADLINPKIIIPMHYKTPKLTFELEPMDNFTRYFDEVKSIKTNELEINNDILNGHKRVVVLNYKAC